MTPVVSVTPATDRPPVFSNLTDPADRRSACPGLFRLAPALDGGICRVKLAGGCLTAVQAQAIAAAAQRFSQSPIELTNRANFQIRGVQPTDEIALVEALVTAGLGPQAKTDCAIDDPLLRGSDDVRNVMVSPLAGRDPQQVADVLPLAARLLTTVQGDARYHALSPKFAIQIDGGEHVAMLHHPHDLWLAVISPDEVAIGLAGCMPQEGDATVPPGDLALAAAPLAAAHDLVCAALDLFLEIGAAQAAVSRMKQLPADLRGAAFIDRLQARLPFRLRRDAAISCWRRRPTLRGAHLGIIAEDNPGRVSVGAAAPLGRLLPAQLTALADLARGKGDGSLRFTPWQSIILPSVATPDAVGVLQALEALDLTTQAAAPFAQMIACAGSAGCGSALAATQSDGMELAAQLATRGTAFPVHLSGCGKSCAALRAEPATLVGVSPGHYDLYRQQAGADSRFGRLLAANITIDDAADVLADLARSKLAPDGPEAAGDA